MFICLYLHVLLPLQGHSLGLAFRLLMFYSVVFAWLRFAVQEAFLRENVLINTNVVRAAVEARVRMVCVLYDMQLSWVRR